MDKEKLKKNCQEYADKEGLMLNPDEKMLDMVFSGLLRNEKLHGEIYCPCRRVTDDKEENKRIICPCSYHKEEIKEDGHCKCFLFFKR